MPQKMKKPMKLTLRLFTMYGVVYFYFFQGLWYLNLMHCILDFAGVFDNLGHALMI